MSDKYTLSARLRAALVGAALLALGAAASCTYSHGDPAPACDVPRENVTYAKVISPIFDANCRECHGSTVYPVKGGGNNFGDYQALSSYFSPSKLLGCIRHDPGFDPMPQGRQKLSDCDIQRIEAWIAAGKPNN
ncbi:cytochrome c [Hymenobacter sp. 5317J-9]|uniref:c-type cytochrome n=1 Tax=Hymenobacter sp. 5317J-9 TaxID=2932250 RepID=UPI001FD6BBCB|nr:cytochrome c [Hymenobacter sp. 5317J-9]UOQ98545.1 cytochrome c [Hymenobacter sp. 5317J-9]